MTSQSRLPGEKITYNPNQAQWVQEPRLTTRLEMQHDRVLVVHLAAEFEPLRMDWPKEHDALEQQSKVRFVAPVAGAERTNGSQTCSVSEDECFESEKFRVAPPSRAASLHPSSVHRCILSKSGASLIANFRRFRTCCVALVPSVLLVCCKSSLEIRGC